jgi:hypothetical protein
VNKRINEREVEIAGAGPAGLAAAITVARAGGQARVVERYSEVGRRLGGLLRLAVVNRYLYERLGDRGYPLFLPRVARAGDARDWLRRLYAQGPLRSLLYRWASRRLAARAELIQDCPEGCDCTWCRCRHESSRVPAAEQ